MCVHQVLLQIRQIFLSDLGGVKTYSLTANNNQKSSSFVVHQLQTEITSTKVANILSTRQTNENVTRIKELVQEKDTPLTWNWLRRRMSLLKHAKAFSGVDCNGICSSSVDWRAELCKRVWRLSEETSETFTAPHAASLALKGRRYDDKQYNCALRRNESMLT